jgi:hypothetical protein
VDEKKLDLNANKSDTKKYVPYAGYHIRVAAVRSTRSGFKTTP